MAPGLLSTEAEPAVEPFLLPSKEVPAAEVRSVSSHDTLHRQEEKQDAPQEAPQVAPQAAPQAARAAHSTLPPAARKLLQDVLHEHAAKRPNAPAISSWDAYLTYKKLDELSTRLAHHLTSLGVTAGTIVPILCEKSSWPIVGMLAVAKAGAAFAAFDASHPDERLIEIVRDVQASVLLASNSQLSRLPGELFAHVVTLSEAALSALSPAPAELALNGTLSPDSLLYTIFTSGSTGRPKGVMIEHSAFITSALAHGAAQGFGEKSRVLQFASYAFDASVQEIFTTLIFGGCVCVPSEEHRFGDLPAFINKTGVNLAVLTPSYAQLLDPVSLPSLRTLVLCGEPVSSEFVGTWAPHLDLLIGYGPTEAAICSAVTSPLQMSGGIDGLIGQPVGCEMWIVSEDNHDELLHEGETGELLIEGPILARGYLNDEQKTAAAFVENPAWASHEEQVARRRFYKTGDLVRRLADGNLVFVGRKDTQVKIQGMRFELAEIESRLVQALPTDWIACVEKVQAESTQTSALVAFISKSVRSATTESPSLDGESSEWLSSQISEIRASLAKLLPAAMVPATYLALTFLPLTTSGKTDRKGLRQLANTLTEQNAKKTEKNGASEQISVEELTPTESTIRDLWAAVLNRKVESIKADDDFIQIGGDSITSIKLVGAAREKGLRLTASMILSHPRLRDLARVSSEDGGGEEAPIPPMALLGDPAAGQMLRMVGAAICRVDPGEIEDILPTSMFQMHMVGATMKNPKAYVDSHCFQLPKDVDVDRLRQALDATVSSIELLRARIIASPDRKLFQAILKHHPAELQVVDDLNAYVQQTAQIPMTVGTPLSRYALIRRKTEAGEEKPPMLMWTLHHAIYDGYSMSLILDAISAHYHGATPAPFTPFSQYLKGPDEVELQAGQNFWTSHLAGSHWAKFPRQLSDGQTPPRPGRITRSIPSAPNGSAGILTTTLIRTAFAAALAPYSEATPAAADGGTTATAGKRVLFLEALSGRNAALAGVDRVAGPTVKTVPTLLSLPPATTAGGGSGPSRAEVLAGAQAHLAARLRHESFPLMRLLPLWAGTPGDFALRCMLVVQDAALLAATGGGSSSNALFSAVEEDAEAAPNMDEADEMPVSFRVFLPSSSDEKKAIEVEARYDQNLVGEEEMGAFVDRFEKAFGALRGEGGEGAFAEVVAAEV